MWIRAKYVEKRFVSKIRPRRLNSAARKLRRKHPIKKFSDGKIRLWSAKKEESEAIEISKKLSQNPSSHETDGMQKESVALDDCEAQSQKEAPSPKSDSSDDRAPYTPPLARCQIEHGIDSATSSDECETEEEMRSLPPNQVGICSVLISVCLIVCTDLCTVCHCPAVYMSVSSIICSSVLHVDQLLVVLILITIRYKSVAYIS